MHIQIDTDKLTDQDRLILLAIAGALSDTDVFADAPSAETPAPKKRATRKKAESKPSAEEVEETLNEAVEEASEPAKLASVPDPEPAVDPKDLINDAAERAVKLIRSGKRDEVKAILDGLGLEKVTALKDSPELVPEFLDRISELEG